MKAVDQRDFLGVARFQGSGSRTGAPDQRLDHWYRRRLDAACSPAEVRRRGCVGMESDTDCPAVGCIVLVCTVVARW